jgi:two-component system phosphate regulon sensor histidine kinase PhoR
MLGVWLLVAIPALLVLSCAVLILVYHQSSFDVAMGVFLVCLCITIGAGAGLTIAGILKDRKLAALQMDFVSKVSHELKTPLTSIRMFTQTLQRGRIDDPKKIENCLEVISKETDRLSLLIGRLLSWGRMEAGAFAINPEALQPETFVLQAIAAFESQAQAAMTKIDFSFEPNLPLLSVDAQALTDAIVNLLSNALRFSPDSDTIWVSIKRNGPKFIDISVRDEGVGIELKEQSRIFERFYSADERISRSTGGTGLGLAIAKHIVSAHDGVISVESKPQNGSTFTIQLPCKSAEVPA